MIGSSLYHNPPVSGPGNHDKGEMTMEKVTYKIEHLTELEQAMEVARQFREEGYRVLMIYGERITVYAEQN